MTIEEIAALTGLSVEYWEKLENGHVIQSRAIDNYLRFMLNPPTQDIPASPPEEDRCAID